MKDEIKKVLAEATPRPWDIGMMIRGELFGARNCDLVFLAVNSYEANQERIASLERWKSEALEALARWNAVGKFVRNSPTVRLGEFVQDEAIRLLTADQERIALLTDANAKLGTELLKHSDEVNSRGERIRLLTEALEKLVDYTYEYAIPGGDGVLQALRAHANAALSQSKPKAVKP